MSLHVQLLDQSPATNEFLQDVLEGLSHSPKSLPCKHFYDEEGSKLFDQICDSKEYYLTRIELSIMQDHAHEMVAYLGSKCILIEFGSGSSWKTRLLLNQLPSLLAYVPIDISREHLQQSANRLAESYPHVSIHPLCADFTKPLQLSLQQFKSFRRVVYFPGSTIGNFRPQEAIQVLNRIGRLSGPGGGLLIGVDLKKSKKILEAAYNDERGITAAFNLNLLRRINRELGGNFDLKQFRHCAFYNEEKGRVEMHLVSLKPQTVRIGKALFRFEEEENIHTENSHKYSLEEFRQMARETGFAVRKVWTDSDNLFSVQYLEKRSN